jgi:diguanylate cyclase (GGDEF)-like protein
VADHGLTIAWLVVIYFIALFRGGLVVAFQKRQRAFEMKGWERLFTSSFVTAGFCWGVGGWLLLPDAFAYRAMIFFFLVGMASAAVAVYSIHVWAVMFTILALVLPTTLDFALQDSAQERLMALSVVLFVIAAFRSLSITNHFVHRSHSLSYELKRAKEQAEMLARTDFLTGMNNRRSFYDLCETPFKLARRYGQDLAAILFDIDQFKNINDVHGHAVGDEVLRNLAGIVAETCRESDVAGRVGGEEFAILLPHTNAENAHELAERLRERMEKSVVHLDRGDVKFTASFGVTQMCAECETLEALIALADGAMYKAKQRGRNGVFVAVPTTSEDAPL